MIRTRNAVLLVIFLVIASLCAFLFFVVQVVSFDSVAKTLLVHDQAESSYAVLVEREEKSRTDTISRLQALLLRDEVLVAPSPSVEEEILTDMSSSTEDNLQTIESTLVVCGADDSEGYSALWPKNAYVSVRDGLRYVEYTTTSVQAEPVDSASGTVSIEPELLTRTLFSSRAFPVKLEQPSCVPGSIVGVTPSALPVSNDASVYSSYGSDSLVGYARDGFPIYGVYEGEVDACGGYHHAQGYRYTLSPQRETVLNCFFATPAAFEEVIH